MKTAKLCLILVIFFSLIIFSVTACDWNGDGGSPIEGTPQPEDLQGYHLTATYGASLLHVQLTAMANSKLAGDSGNP
ncbi:MAG: hypothetical protein H6Q37_741 [Chloroflexi bacterium]|nr:hypothetical protein [Chloroflexota bacterium]